MANQAGDRTWRFRLTLGKGLAALRLRLRDFKFTAPWVLYLVSLLLHQAVFAPDLGELNVFDEAAYINRGREVFEIGLPIFASNPLVAFVYALNYLLTRNSPFWMVHSASLGRITLFSLLWLSTYLIAKELKAFSRPVVALGILFVTPLAMEFLSLPSDPLFAGLAGLSFWQLLAFFNRRDHRHVWAASFFMGLAAFARNDGLVSFVLLVILTALIVIRTKASWRAVVASVAPFVIMVGGYVLAYGAFTGDFGLGTMQRAYDNFEAGHASIYRGPGEVNAVVEAKLEARRVFGTPQENDYSPFKAIRRNPGVYLERLMATIKGLPKLILLAYGQRFALLLFLLSTRGVIELIRRREYLLLTILFLWPFHLVTGFLITLFRLGHLRFPFYVVFALSAIGLTALIHDLDQRSKRYAWGAVLLAITAVAVVGNKLAIAYGVGVFLIGVESADLARRRFQEPQRAYPVVLLLLFASGLVIRGGFPSPKIRILGDDAQEQAVIYMTTNLPPDTKVAAAAPGVVWAAKMRYLGLTSADVPMGRSPEGFLAWMVSQGAEAVYVDHQLYNVNPAIWRLIKPEIGGRLERVFLADEGDVQVLLIKTSP